MATPFLNQATGIITFGSQYPPCVDSVVQQNVIFIPTCPVDFETVFSAAAGVLTVTGSTQNGTGQTQNIVMSDVRSIKQFTYSAAVQGVKKVTIKDVSCCAAKGAIEGTIVVQDSCEARYITQPIVVANACICDWTYIQMLEALAEEINRYTNDTGCSATVSISDSWILLTGPANGLDFGFSPGTQMFPTENVITPRTVQYDYDYTSQAFPTIAQLLTSGDHYEGFVYQYEVLVPQANGLGTNEIDLVTGAVVWPAGCTQIQDGLFNASDGWLVDPVSNKPALLGFASAWNPPQDDAIANYFTIMRQDAGDAGALSTASGDYAASPNSRIAGTFIRVSKRTIAGDNWSIYQFQSYATELTRVAADSVGDNLRSGPATEDDINALYNSLPGIPT